MNIAIDVLFGLSALGLVAVCIAIEIAEARARRRRVGLFLIDCNGEPDDDEGLTL